MRDDPAMSKTRPQDLPPSMRPEQIGRRLRALLGAVDLASAEMARQVRCDPSAFNKYVRGQRLLPDHVAFRIAQRYGVTMDFLYRERLDAIPEPLRGDLLSRLDAA